VKISDSCVKIVNREYSALGDFKNTFLYKTNADTIIHTTMDPDTNYSIIGKYSADGDNSLYFYNDGNKPWESKKNLIDYLTRLNKILSKLIGCDIKKPMFLR